MKRTQAYEFFGKMDAEKRAFERRMTCMVDLTQECASPSVRSHSISATNLRLIAENGNLLSIQFTPYTNDISDAFKFARVGINRASTFPGFCSEHDSLLFREIDSKSFELSESTLSKYFYRCVAQELFKKLEVSIRMSGVELLNEQFQKHRPVEMEDLITGFDLGIRDLDHMLKRLDSVISEQRTSEIRFLAIQLNSILPYSYIAPINFEAFPQYGILQEDHSVIIPSVMCACIPMDSGTVFACCWLKGSDRTLNPLLRRLQYSAGYLPELLLQFGLEHTENIFFRPSWIDGLSEVVQQAFVDVFRKTNLGGIPNVYWRPLDGIVDFGRYSSKILSNSNKIRTWARGKKL